MFLINQLKDALIPWPNFQINIESETQPNTVSVGRIISNNLDVAIDILIDTVLDSSYQNLSFRLTNVDFKLALVESIGTIYHENGIVRIEGMHITYSDTYNQHVLNINTATPFAPGRMLIVFSNISYTPNIYINHPVNLIPLIIDDTGSGCRPGLYSANSLLEENTNPFK